MKRLLLAAGLTLGCAGGPSDPQAEADRCADPARSVPGGELVSGMAVETALCTKTEVAQFTFVGPDGSPGSARLQIQHGGGEPLTYTYKHSGDLGSRSDVLTVGQSAELVVGSARAIEHMLNLRSDGLSLFRVRMTFEEPRVEIEGISYELPEGRRLVGAVADGDDIDQYTILGVDGTRSVGLEVQFLSGDANELVLTSEDGVGSSLEYRIPPGGRLTHVRRSDTGRVHVFRLFTDALAAEYEITPILTRRFYESEPGRQSGNNQVIADEMSDGSTFFGEIRSGNDADWYTVSRPDGANHVAMVVENLSTTTEGAPLIMRNSDPNLFEPWNVESMVVPPGATAALRLGTQSGYVHWIEIQREGDLGVAIPYRITPQFGPEIWEIDLARSSNNSIQYFEFPPQVLVYGRFTSSADVDYLSVVAPTGTTSMSIDVRSLSGDPIEISGSGVPTTTVRPGDPAIVVAANPGRRDFTVQMAEERIGDGTYTIEVDFQ